jgi:hypothetical protein
MIRLSVLFSSVCIWILTWYECGENPAFFCYRIGDGAFRSARERALATVPVSSRFHSLIAQRTSSACSTDFSTSSGHSITRKH